MCRSVERENGAGQVSCLGEHGENEGDFLPLTSGLGICLRRASANVHAPIPPLANSLARCGIALRHVRSVCSLKVMPSSNPRRFVRAIGASLRFGGLTEQTIGAAGADEFIDPGRTPLHLVAPLLVQVVSNGTLSTSSIRLRQCQPLRRLAALQFSVPLKDDPPDCVPPQSRLSVRLIWLETLSGFTLSMPPATSCG
jgi:hypothetical protein